MAVPNLFGLKKINRDFSRKEAWGKNQFNSSFPASLCCYLAHKKISENYPSVLKRAFSLTKISIKSVFGTSANDDDV